MELLKESMYADGDGTIEIQLGDYIYEFGQMGGCEWIRRFKVGVPRELLEEEPTQWGPFGEDPNLNF
jgi:hypothetical protein